MSDDERESEKLEEQNDKPEKEESEKELQKEIAEDKDNPKVEGEEELADKVEDLSHKEKFREKMADDERESEKLNEKEGQKDEPKELDSEKKPEKEIEEEEEGQKVEGQEELAEKVENLSVDEKIRFPENITVMMMPAPDLPRSPRPPMCDAVRNLIMHYINPVKRFDGFKPHAALYKLHQQVPLWIREMEVSPCYLRLNPIKYTYTTILLRLDGRDLPPGVARCNKEGGLPFDVTKNGKEIRDDWTPGDIKVHGPFKPKMELDGEFDVFVRSVREHQFGGPKLVQSVKDQRIGSLMKTLLGEILGGGQCHFVKNLQVTPFCRGLIRFPAGLKLRVNGLTCEIGTLDDMLTIIHEDSLPLMMLSTYTVTPKDPRFKHPVLRSAGLLRLSLPPNCQEQDWVDLITGLTNYSIELYSHELHFKQLFRVIQNWLDKPRRRGSNFSMWMVKFDYAMGVLQKLLGGNECVIPGRTSSAFPTGISIPIDEDTEELELNFYATLEPGDLGPRLTLNMVCMPRGSCRLVYRISKV